MIRSHVYESAEILSLIKLRTSSGSKEKRKIRMSSTLMNRISWRIIFLGVRVNGAKSSGAVYNYYKVLER